MISSNLQLSAARHARAAVSLIAFDFSPAADTPPAGTCVDTMSEMISG
jgi:hypothetical protein